MERAGIAASEAETEMRSGQDATTGSRRGDGGRVDAERAASGPARSSTLAERLRQKRKEHRWTQVQLAERVGTSQAVIQKIENGKSLRPRIIDGIAAALGVTPAWLMFGEGRPERLGDEALEVASAWSKLVEPHRSALKQAILERARSA